MSKETRCPYCLRTFSESTGLEVDPKTANVVSATVCASCIEKSNAKVLREIAALRAKALKDLAGVRV